MQRLIPGHNDVCCIKSNYISDIQGKTYIGNVWNYDMHSHNNTCYAMNTERIFVCDLFQ